MKSEYSRARRRAPLADTKVPVEPDVLYPNRSAHQSLHSMAAKPPLPARRLKDFRWIATTTGNDGNGPAMSVIDQVRIGMTREAVYWLLGRPEDTGHPSRKSRTPKYLSILQYRISFRALGDGPTGQGLYGGCGWQRNGTAEMSLYLRVHKLRLGNACLGGTPLERSAPHH